MSWAQLLTQTHIGIQSQGVGHTLQKFQNFLQTNYLATFVEGKKNGTHTRDTLRLTNIYILTQRCLGIGRKYAKQQLTHKLQ